MRRRRRLTTRLALAAIIASALPTAGSARAADFEPTAYDGSAGRIAFVDDAMDDVPVIASMLPDGSDVRQLTTSSQSPYGDVDPAWSPGGTMIAFTRLGSSGRGEIWRMNADGSGQRRLTNNASDDAYPTWSADGARIAFASDRSGNYDIYTMSTDGASPIQLTDHPAADIHPAWKADNKKVAFASDRRGLFEIHTMKADGSGETRVTDASDWNAQLVTPDWNGTPVNEVIVFTSISLSDPGEADISMAPSRPGFQAWPAFAPYDASLSYSQIVFQSDEAGDDDLVIHTDGGVDEVLFDRPGDQSQPDWQAIPFYPLVDVRFSPFWQDIQWIHAEGITVGCSPERYCPNDPVSRAQMATFLVRALDLPSTGTDYFTDDETSSHEADINRLAAAAITSGCAQTLYCPTKNVTRGEMASFLARAFDLPATATDYFDDDDGTTHEANINKVAAAGITSGCGPTSYCPTANVTRGQMAAFLRRALE